MTLFPRLRSFLTTLTQRERCENSLDEEVRFHLDAQTEDLVRTGVPPEEAARRAREQFGSIEAMKNDCRRVRSLCNIRLVQGTVLGAIAAAQPGGSPIMASIADHVAARFRAILADYERNPTAEAARAAVSRLEGLEFGLLSNEDLCHYERLVRRAAGPK